MKNVKIIVALLLLSNFLFSQSVKQYGDTMFTPGSASLLKTTRCTTTGTMYVAFKDNAAAGKITIMQNFGTGWVFANTQGISTGAVNTLDIVIGVGDFPIIAYTDVLYSNKLIVKQFDGANWNALGSSAGFTAGPVSDVAISYNYTSGLPSVAFKDPSSGGKITVMTWDGANWNLEGIPGFSAGAVGHVDIQFAAGYGNNIVAYKDSTTLKGHAMNFNGSAWVNLPGSSPFTNGEIKFLDMEIDSVLMIPIFGVSEFDGSNYRASVYKFDGISVNPVGSPFFSTGPANFISVGSDITGITVAAFRDASAGNKITVMHNSGGASWTMSNNLPSGPIGSCDIAMGPMRDYYVAYTDSAFGAQINTRKLFFPLQPTLVSPGGPVPLCAGSSVNLSVPFQVNAINTWIDSLRWDTLGSVFTAGPVNDLSYIANPQGNSQFVAIRDGANGNKLAVYAYISNTWQTIGGATLTSSSVAFPDIQLDQYDMPLVAFRDDGSGIKASVLRWNGSTWTYVGAPGFSAGNAQEISLAIDHGGRPIVAYKDVVNANKLTVMFYNGSNWVSLGPPGFTPGQADNPCIKVSPLDEIFVCYSDQTNGGKATLKKWANPSWVDVGPPGFSSGSATNATIDFDHQNSIYSAFVDGTQAGKITAMKYDNISWSTLGAPGFTPGNTFNSKIKVDVVGNPFVGYIDNHLSNNRAIIQRYNGTSWDTICHKAISSSMVNLFDYDVTEFGLPSGVVSLLTNGDKLVALTLNGHFITNGTSITPNQPGSYMTYVQHGNSSASLSANDATLFNAPNPNVSIIASDTILCNGTADTLIANGANIYTWFNTSTNDTLIFNPSITGTYHVIGENAFGCKDSVAVQITVPYYGVTGTVTDGLGPIASGDVYYFSVNPSNGLYDTLTQSTIFAGGVYLQDSLVNDNYIFQVHLDTILYPNAVITYNGNEYLWDSVSPIIHTCFDRDTINIQVVEMNNPGGIGYISGYVYEGAGFGQRINQGPGQEIYANVIPGVPIKVGKNPSGNIIGTATTDGFGFYEVGNLPADNYYVFTDLPGFGMDTLYTITIGSGLDTINNLDYFVDSNSVYIDLSTSIKNTETNYSALSVYPNPTNSNFTLKFEVLENANVLCELYNLQGEKINVILNRKFEKGVYSINENLNQFNLSNGTYMIKTNINNHNSYFKLVVIK